MSDKENQHAPVAEYDYGYCRKRRILKKGDTLTAQSIPVSDKDGQVLTVEDDGLYISGTDSRHEDSSTVKFSGDGTDADPLKAEVKVSGASGNTVEKKDGGLFVAKPDELPSFSSSDAGKVLTVDSNGKLKWSDPN